MSADLEISYAQNREDLYINWLLDGQEKGFYVDVGANDPDIDSVTKYFYEKGWSGLHVEPIKRHADALHEKRPRDRVLQVGISTKPGKLKFREYVDGDGLSTFSTDMQNEYEEAEKHLDYEVEVKRLDDVLESEGVTKIDFLKIDVEGYEYEVISSNNWKMYRPKLLIIEANHLHSDWRPIIKKAGYDLAFFDGVNEYYMDDVNLIKRARETYPRYMIGPLHLNLKELRHIEWREETARGQVQNEEYAKLEQANNTVKKLRAELLAERTMPISMRTKRLAKDILRAIKRRVVLNLAPRTITNYRDTTDLRSLIVSIDTGLKINQEEIFNILSKSDKYNMPKIKKSMLRTFLYRLLKVIYTLGRRILRFCKHLVRRLRASR